MKITLKVLRRSSPEAQPRWETVDYEYPAPAATVASALRDLERTMLDPIRWEHSCLQKKCGACAMVINGRPGLACDARLDQCAKNGTVTLEPLKKFAPLADLMVDRAPMMKALRDMELWLRGPAPADQRTLDTAYEASRCLQCGCCLEVCPNFCTDIPFLGTAAMAPFSRILAEEPDRTKRQAYMEHFYKGCGKSLACRNVCPAGIDVDKLLVSSNAAAAWKRLLSKKKDK